MDQDGAQPYFIISTPPEVVQREKEKARALRKTQWWQRQISKGVCHYCSEPFSPKELTMDHIVPLIRGGRSTRGNVAAACKTCNSKKKYLLPIEWEEYLQSLSSPTASGMAVSHADECQEDDHGRM